MEKTIEPTGTQYYLTCPDLYFYIFSDNFKNNHSLI